MKKRAIIIVVAVAFCVAAVFAGLLASHVICPVHEWKNATCTEPKTCLKCGEVEGMALGHKRVDANCEEAMTCVRCNMVKGEALGHKWEDATCTQPKTCAVCGKTEGTPLEHEWLQATCTEAKQCTLCGEIDGEALGHKWDAANCIEPKTCSVCGKTEGQALGHQVTEWSVVTEASCINEGEKTGKCEICGRNVTETIPITDHTPGEWVVTVEPTELEPGEWTQYCAVCGEVVATEEYELSAEEIETRYKNKCTGYYYETIARDPEGYKGTYGRYTGEVVQVMEESFLGVKMYNLRINVTKEKYGYTDTIYVTYVAGADEPRILEDDIVTIWGENCGTKTYKTVLGATVTIPEVNAEYLEIQ